MAKNKILEEMLKKAKATSVSSAGMYMRTAATSVFTSDGKPIESNEEDVPKEDPLEPLEPETPEEPTNTVDNESIAETLNTVEDNAVVKVTEGAEITTDLSITKSVTTQGDNAGIAQNFKQEV